MNNQEGLETIWEAPDELWELIGPIILEADPPKVEAASGLTPDRCSTASFSACAAGANGTDCRKNWGTTAQSIAPFQAQVLWVILGELRTNMDHNRLQWSQCKDVGRSWAGMAGGRRGHGQCSIGPDLIGPQANGSRLGCQPCREPLLVVQDRAAH